MKKAYCIILISSIVMSCQTKKIHKTEQRKSEKRDTIQQVVERLIATEKKHIFIKDSTDYSSLFLKAIETARMKTTALIDNFLILEENDTIRFPEIPSIGKKTILTAKQGQLDITLTIERINQTTIDYAIEMLEFGNVSYKSKGQADLSSHFYFGAETDTNSLSGMGYLSTEFRNNQDSCYTHIRLGIDENSGTYLLGKLKKNYNGKIKDIELNNFPTLVEKQQ
ncbi:MAG: hypothetical protein V3V28_02685 [Polaribacter sp.]|uniref:hypothetical protein n=1 Tax=Polaribacter sp. TaxID=1920175 RepID=UPI002F358FB8